MATVNDIVLIHVDNKPGFYARIENVTADLKPGWWQVRLLVLTFPLQVFSWILDEFQLEGAPFTMGGTPIRMELVVSPLEKERQSQNEELRGDEPDALDGALESQPKKSANTKVVSLLDRRKK